MALKSALHEINLNVDIYLKDLFEIGSCFLLHQTANNTQTAALRENTPWHACAWDLYGNLMGCKGWFAQPPPGTFILTCQHATRSPPLLPGQLMDGIQFVRKRGRAWRYFGLVLAVSIWAKDYCWPRSVYRAENQHSGTHPHLPPYSHHTQRLLISSRVGTHRGGLLGLI